MKTKRLTPKELVDYRPGKGCKCHAWVELECCCNTWNDAMTKQNIKVDWTPKEVYELRNRVHELEEKSHTNMVNALDWVHDVLLDDCNTAEECRQQIVNYTVALSRTGDYDE